ncbi:MAG: DNA-3-methyladenine glycosylase [Candidatus Dormibacteraceae bacterium]
MKIKDGTNFIGRGKPGPYIRAVEGAKEGLSGEQLDEKFFDRSPLEVAPELLGKLLIRGDGSRQQWGRVVETEAYCGPEDLAAHSARGLTPRTRVMFGPPAHIYVYLIYGIYHCLNFVCQPEGVPQAVLIRALEPGPGVGRCAGPGLLCRALGIDLALNGRPIQPPHLYLVDDGYSPVEIHQTPRIGVDYAGDWRGRPWRYCLNSPHLSRKLSLRDNSNPTI